MIHRFFKKINRRRDKTSIGTLSLCYCTMQSCRQLPNCCLYKFSPKHSPIKTKPQPHWSKWWTIKIFWPISNKLLSFWNLKIALVDLEILEKGYITLTLLHVPIGQKLVSLLKNCFLWNLNFAILQMENLSNLNSD